MFRSFMRSAWHGYQNYVETAMQNRVHHRVKDLEYWQNRLFTNAILYALPLSLLALFPSMYLELQAGHPNIIIFDLLALSIVGLVSLKKGFTLHTRKVIVAAVVVFFSVVLTAVMGAFSIGCIYLFSLSVFVALQFSDRVAYGMVVVNVLYCLGFDLVLRYRLIDIPLLNTITADRWTIYSVNFIFMDMIIVGLIRQILNGLEHTMLKEEWLYGELQKEMKQKAHLNDNLKDSEEDYRTLFYQSPSPKFIFDANSLQFLQVNAAAVHSYGYTENEFMNMKLTDIYPAEDIAQLFGHARVGDGAEVLSPYRARHMGKDGKSIHTEIRHSNITYKGRKARIIVATDITQRVQHLAAIQAQNEKLKEIAYMQSHVIRLPLARIMSLAELMDSEYDGKFDRQLLDHLNTSAHELDTVVRQVVNRSADILAEYHIER